MELFLGEREQEIRTLVQFALISQVVSMQKPRFRGHRGRQGGHEGLGCPLFLNIKMGYIYFKRIFIIFIYVVLFYIVLKIKFSLKMQSI